MPKEWNRGTEQPPGQNWAVRVSEAMLNTT